MNNKLGKHSQLFSAGENYAQFRPVYPEALYNYVVSQIEDKKTALDIGCGTGQTTIVLSKYFEKVFGIDNSESQIRSACKAENIEYAVGIGEDLSNFSDQSIDLITIAQAIHWMNEPKLWKEVKRVTKNGGGVAVWGYEMAKIKNNELATKVITDYHTSLWDGGYWEPNRKLVDDHYSHLQLPFSTNIKTNEFFIEKDLTIERLISYLKTASAYKTFNQRNPNAVDPLIEVEAKLIESCGATDNQFIVPISHQIFLYLSLNK